MDRHGVQAIADRSIDLNADVGEHDSADADAPLLSLVSSLNIACGFHAGTPLSIAKLIRRAAAVGLAIGAHPSYPDRAGFGRRAMDASPEEIHDDVLYQIGALDALCRAGHTRVTHVKLHGALYNRAAADPDVARAVRSAVSTVSRSLPIYAPPASVLLQQARAAGERAIAEVFCDRAYNLDGTLVSRRSSFALILDPAEVAARALQLVLENRVSAVDGTLIPLVGETLCLHGDGPDALQRARAVRSALDRARVRVAAPYERLPQ